MKEKIDMAEKLMSERKFPDELLGKERSTVSPFYRILHSYRNPHFRSTVKRAEDW